MNREDVVTGYLMNKPRVVAEMLYDTIAKYENKLGTCEECEHGILVDGPNDIDIIECGAQDYKTYWEATDYCSYFKGD